MQREKTIAVLGLARAGIPAAKFLAARGAHVVGYDDKSREQLGDAASELESLGVELRLGEHGFAGLEECATIVLSPGLKIHHEPLRSVLLECATAGAEIIGELELAARHCIAPIIAVTGTKGKSTTTKLIYEMLRASGVQTVRAGNTGTPLVAMLGELTSDAWAVVEVSSFQLEFAPTFKPRVAVLLNLMADHLDYHTSLEQYWTTKLKIFANQGEGDVGICNVDDEGANEIWVARQEGDTRASSLKTARFWPSSATGEGQVGYRDGFLGWQIEGKFQGVIEADEVPLKGAHNLANVAAALAATLAALGEEAADKWAPAIAEAIRTFESLPHRLENVGEARGLNWINDSQATIPDAAEAALQSFGDAPITLIAGGLNKLDLPDAFDELGLTVAKRAHCLITIGSAATQIEDAARRAGMPDTKIISASDLTNAVQSAIMATPHGGIVLLSPACASFDQFQSFEDRGEQFRAAVAALQSANDEAH